MNFCRRGSRLIGKQKPTDLIFYSPQSGEERSRAERIREDKRGEERRQDETRRDETRRDDTRRYKTRQYDTIQDARGYTADRVFHTKMLTCMWIIYNMNRLVKHVYGNRYA